MENSRFDRTIEENSNIRSMIRSNDREKIEKTSFDRWKIRDSIEKIEAIEKKSMRIEKKSRKLKKSRRNH